MTSCTTQPETNNGLSWTNTANGLSWTNTANGLSWTNTASSTWEIINSNGEYTLEINWDGTTSSDSVFIGQSLPVWWAGDSTNPNPTEFGQITIDGGTSAGSVTWPFIVPVSDKIYSQEELEKILEEYKKKLEEEKSDADVIEFKKNPYENLEIIEERKKPENRKHYENLEI